MNLFFDMMGFDWVAEVEYKVTSWGRAPSWYDPGDPIEIEVSEIWISLDKGKNISTPSFQATGALFDTIYDRIEEELYETVSTNGPPDYDGDY